MECVHDEQPINERCSCGDTIHELTDKDAEQRNELLAIFAKVREGEPLAEVLFQCGWRAGYPLFYQRLHKYGLHYMWQEIRAAKRRIRAEIKAGRNAERLNKMLEAQRARAANARSKRAEYLRARRAEDAEERAMRDAAKIERRRLERNERMALMLVEREQKRLERQRVRARERELLIEERKRAIKATLNLDPWEGWTFEERERGSRTEGKS